MGHALSVVNLKDSYHTMAFNIRDQHHSYHPASNGVTERGVQILRQGLKKIKDGPIEERLTIVHFNYRITPQSITGISTA